MPIFDIGRVTGASQRRAGAAQALAAPTSTSTSGQYLPFPELSQQLATQYVDILGGIAGQIGQGTGANQPGGGSASDFSGYLQNVGGPGTPFTNVPIQGVYTPQQVNEGVNAIYADTDARAANQARTLSQSLAPGFGAGSPLLAEMLQNNAGRMQAIGADQAREFGQDAARMNAAQELASRNLQLNVEAQRAANDLQRRSLGLTARGQDFGRESDLLRALLSGVGGGAGGLLGPLSFSESSSAPSVFAQQNNPYGRRALR